MLILLLACLLPSRDLYSLAYKSFDLINKIEAGVIKLDVVDFYIQT